MMMVSYKNDNFRIYLITVFISTRNRKVEKCGGVRKMLNFHERGFVGWKSLETAAIELHIVFNLLLQLLVSDTRIRIFF
jgi:hypothetical protein